MSEMMRTHKYDQTVLKYLSIRPGHGGVKRNQLPRNWDQRGESRKLIRIMFHSECKAFGTELKMKQEFKIYVY